jgi:hypothetical protein
MENILIENIVMKNVEGPLFVRPAAAVALMKSQRSVYDKDAEKEGAGHPTGDRAQEHSRRRNGDDRLLGIMITGVPGATEDVLPENVEISSRKWWDRRETWKVVGGGRCPLPEFDAAVDGSVLSAFTRRTWNSRTWPDYSRSGRPKIVLEDVSRFNTEL